MKPDESMEQALDAYLDTLLWSETLSWCDKDGKSAMLVCDAGEFEDGTPLDQMFSRDEIPESIRESARDDLEAFARSCVDELGFNPVHMFDPAQVGHDFCLSRNGHGAGFFDDAYEIATKSPNATKGRGDGSWTRYSDDLQCIAKYAGTHGLMVYVDTETGDLKLDEHS